ncbi:MAG: hypothetical protein K0S58_2863 [Nitrospira sp.]|nr:hypothetical protein [Nitrospira sp.]
MSCSRCKGCMIEDYLLDMEDSSGPMWLKAWRCMNCGNVFDTVLERNRQTQGVKPISIPSELPLPIHDEVIHASSEEMNLLVA